MSSVQGCLPVCSTLRWDTFHTFWITNFSRLSEKGKTWKKKTKPEERHLEQNLDISNILFLISTLQSPKCTGSLLLWDVQGGKARVKNRQWKQEECSDPGQERTVYPGVGDSQYSYWSRPRSVLCCLQAWVVVHKTLGSRINSTTSLAQSAGDYTTCVALPLSRSTARSETLLWITFMNGCLLVKNLKYRNQRGAFLQRWDLCSLPWEKSIQGQSNAAGMWTSWFLIYLLCLLVLTLSF